MTLEEIQAANAAADKERELVQQAETEGPALSDEELAAKRKEYIMKERQDAVVEKIKKLIEDLVADEHDFTTGELGWASDAFKTCLQLRAIKTAQHEEFVKTNQEASEKFYSTKMKDLTIISDENTSKIEESSDSVGV